MKENHRLNSYLGRSFLYFIGLGLFCGLCVPFEGVLIGGATGLLAGVFFTSRFAEVKPACIKHVSQAIANSGLLLLVLDNDNRRWLGEPEGLEIVTSMLVRDQEKSFRQQMKLLIRNYLAAIARRGWRAWPPEVVSELQGKSGMIGAGMFLVGFILLVLMGIEPSDPGLMAYAVVSAGAFALLFAIMYNAACRITITLGLCDLLLDAGWDKDRSGWDTAGESDYRGGDE